MGSLSIVPVPDLYPSPFIIGLVEASVSLLSLGQYVPGLYPWVISDSRLIAVVLFFLLVNFEVTPLS